jgi:sec-independent protein translocase protein TatA
MGLDNPLHIAFLVVILLLVFGARRLPEIGRSLGSGMREFKESISGESKPAQAALPQAAQPQPQPPAAQTQPQPPAAQPAPAAPQQPAEPAQPAEQAQAEPTRLG